MALSDRLNAANAKRTANASTPAEPPAQAKPVLPTPEERAEALNVDRAQVQKLGQETEAPTPSPATRVSSKPRILLVSGAVVSGSSKVKYLDDLMAPAMAKIQATKGVPYFAIQYNEGAKLLAASFPDVADQINVGDILVVRGDISWTQLVVEQVRQRFEVVDVVGVR